MVCGEFIVTKQSNFQASLFFLNGKAVKKHNNMHNNLPDFLIIGAQKCGTTWLWNEIRQHPNIFMPEGKELHYFSNDGSTNFQDDGSLDWYKKFFVNSGEANLLGESTPSYIYRPESAQNIFSVIPDVKLIVTLRQPAERAYSQWCMQRKRKVVPLEYSFVEAFYSNERKQVGMRERGFYYSQLLRYFEFFERDKISIFLYDELKNDYRSYLKKIYSFLNVNDEFVSSTADRILHPKLSNIPDTSVSIPIDEKREITKYYLDSINRLEDLLKFDLTDWKEFK